MPSSPSIISPRQAIDPVAAIASASRRTGVSFDLLFNQARVESAMNPDAKAKTSSATGLFQFTKQTWLATLKAHGAKHNLGWAADLIESGPNGRMRIADPAMRQTILNLRTDPTAASDMAAEFAADNAAGLERILGRVPDDVDVYLAHFLGLGGAKQFLNGYAADPHAAAAPVLPSAAAANRSIFYTKAGQPRSFADIRARFAAKLNSDAPPVPNAPFQMAARPAQFLEPQRPMSGWADEAPRPMPVMVDMPKRLSLAFAHATYRRLGAAI
jgi:hypothetical protein